MFLIILKLILLWFTLLKAAYSNENTCTFENDIDYLGQDLTTLPNYLDNPGLCCKSCLFNEKCKLWTYLPETKACWLKSTSASIRITSFGVKYYFMYITFIS